MTPREFIVARPEPQPKGNFTTETTEATEAFSVVSVVKSSSHGAKKLHAGDTKHFPD